jgi:hypothetical protein
VGCPYLALSGLPSKGAARIDVPSSLGQKKTFFIPFSYVDEEMALLVIIHYSTIPNLVYYNNMTSSSS